MAHQNLFYDSYANFAAVCNGDPDDVPTYCFIEPQYNPANNPAAELSPPPISIPTMTCATAKLSFKMYTTLYDRMMLCGIRARSS